jgi:hypothetical protein
MPIMRHLPRILSILALCLGVAACFTSPAPLIAPADAAFPFERLTFRPLGDEDEMQTLARDGDLYRFTNATEPDKHGLVRLRAIGEDLYVVAFWLPPEAEDAEKMPVLYALLAADLPANRVLSYASIKPDDFAPVPGIVPCDREACIEDLDAYVAYAKGRIDAGIPPDVTYEILSVE